MGDAPDLAKIMDSPGTPLTAAELEKLRADGLIPAGMNVGVQSQPIVHRITTGGQEYLVIVIDPPPCGCTRDAKGEKKRCKTHRRKDRKKKKKKTGAKKSKTNVGEDNMIRDDGSDRGAAKELRHAADSEDEYEKIVEGAVTPDGVCATGPAGTAVIVAIQPKEGQNVAPKAVAPAKPIKGILIRGADDCPQFIPAEKVPKDAKGQDKMHRFTTGQLVKGADGKAIFVADNGPQIGEDGKPKNVEGPGINAEVQKNIGGKVQIACEVDVNEKGMVEIRQINDMAQANQDKNACVGVITQNEAAQVVFMQTGGQAVGAAGDGGEKVGEARKNAKPGDAFAVVTKTGGKLQTVTLQDAAKVDKKDIAAVVIQGAYYEPVVVQTKNAEEVNKLLDKPEARKEALQQIEQERKKAEKDIEDNDIAAAAKTQKRPIEEVKREAERAKKARMGAASGADQLAPGAGGGAPGGQYGATTAVGAVGGGPGGAKEVASVAFGQYGNACGGNRSVFATAQPTGYGAAGGPKPLENKSGYAGAGAGGGTKEAASMACFGAGAAYTTNYKMVTPQSTVGNQGGMSQAGGAGGGAYANLSSAGGAMTAKEAASAYMK